MRLPANAPFMPAQAAPPVNALPALSNGYLTFGSFNRPSKISRSAIALWAQLLRALPDSRMLLGAMPKDGNYTTLIEWFAQEGIARERLDFHVRSDMERYLGLHHQVDICLDTFPYNWRHHDPACAMDGRADIDPGGTHGGGPARGCDSGPCRPGSVCCP